MRFEDLLVAPIFFLIIFVYASMVKRKYYLNNDLGKYFMPALMLKLLGALAAGFVYYYYYSDGDTRGYYNRGFFIRGELLNDFESGIAYFYPELFDLDSDQKSNLFYILKHQRDPASFLMYRISGFIQIFTFGTYVATAFIFASFSFIFSWKTYKLLVGIYPSLHKELATAIFFMPSVFFWTSGIFKDTVCIAAIMAMLYSIMTIFLNKNYRLKYFVLIGISGYLLFIIKAYILMSFIPALLLWVFLNFQSKIKNHFTRMMITPVFIVIVIAGAVFTIQKIGEFDTTWNIESTKKKAHDMQEWHTTVALYHPEGDEGGYSYYTLGTPGDITISGMLQKFPLAVNVTLFRPYIWEARKPFVLLSAIESLYFFILFIKTLKLTGLRKFFTIIFSNELILFSFVFTLVFAFGVGFTSYNFGALVRYKTPCMPFFLISIFLIRYQYAKELNSIKVIA